MAYREPAEKFGNDKPQPKPDWTDMLTDKSTRCTTRTKARARNPQRPVVT
jgi:hypothetical protein